MTADTKTCVDCGATFEKSRADYTVRCMACRAKRRDARRAPAVSSMTEVYELRMYAARSAGMKARSEGDSETYERELATYRHYRDLLGR